MLLHKEQNAISDSGALRTAALALTYYDMDDHPEKGDDLLPCNLCNTTETLTPGSGIIKTSIDEIIDIVESELSKTVDSYKAYCQYYMGNSVEIIENNIQYTGSNNIEPAIHYDITTGFDPEYKPDHIAMMYIGPGTDSTLEFWNHDGQGIGDNFLINQETLTTNDLVIFNHTLAHRMSPSSWGNTQSDSGLHLVLFMKTS
jgi:hypothetical protein